MRKQRGSFLYPCRMSIQGGSLTYAIDVGGERFLLSSDKSVDLAYKGRREFYSIFQPISTSTKIPMDRIELLLRTYLPYPNKKAGIFVFPGGTTDKADLLRILEGRVNQIKETRIHTLLNNNLLHISNRLMELIDTIQLGARTSGMIKKRKPLTENEIFSLILEFSWYLIHPNMEMDNEWEAIVKKMDTKSLDALVQEIQIEEQKQSSGQPVTHKTAMNYFKNIDIKDVVRQPTKEEAMKRIKNMVLFPGSESGKELKTRLRNLMGILTMKKFIDEPLEYRESIPVIKNSDMTVIQQQMLPRIVQGGVLNPVEEEKKETTPTKEISTSLGKAMTPLFDYFKDMYDPIYGFIEDALKEYTKQDGSHNKLMNEILSLLYLSTHLPSKEGSVPKGIYRIQNVSSTALSFVSFMLEYTTLTKLDKFKPVEEKEEFKGQLYKLPVFRLSTFKHGYNTKAYKNPSTLPYVQFMMLNHNVSMKKDADFANQPSGLVDQYRAIQSFFQPNALYLVVSDSNLSDDSQTPMDLFDIDYSTLELNRPIIHTKPVEGEAFKKEDATQKIMLEQVMDVHETTFNQGELLLCVLHLLKKQMPQ